MAKIVIKSTLNSSQYKKGVEDMKRQTGRFSQGLGGIGSTVKGAFAVAAVIAFAKAVGKAIGNLIQFGSELTDLAAQSDVSVEKLQEYKAAVIKAGGNINQLSGALIKLKSAQGDVLSGNKEYAKSFEALGISTQEIASMNTEQLFERVATALTKSGNSAKQYNAALELLGKRGGGKLIEALNIIGDESQRASDKLNRLSTEDAQRLDVIADKWAMFKDSVKVTFARGIGNIIGAFGGNVEAELDDRLKRIKKQEEQARRARLQQAEEQKAVEAAEKEKELQEKITEERKKQAGIRKRLDAVRDQVKIKTDTDQFRKIGGLAGGSISMSLQRARRDLEIQMKQTKILQNIETNTENQGGLA